VYSDETATETIRIVFCDELELYIEMDAIITSMSLPVNFGAALIADISLQVVGKPTTIAILPIDPERYVYE
jgi:hypothetical protein